MNKWKHASYLSQLIRTVSLRRQVSRAAHILKEYEFDAIAFTGLSGALIAIPTALA